MTELNVIKEKKPGKGVIFLHFLYYFNNLQVYFNVYRCGLVCKFTSVCRGTINIWHFVEYFPVYGHMVAGKVNIGIASNQ